MESDNFDHSLPSPKTPLAMAVEALTPPPVLETSVGHSALDNINQSEEDFTNMLAFPSIDEISEERVSELRNARGRRRANSFDVSMPVPRIKLRPRFSGQQSQLLPTPDYRSGSSMSEHSQKVVTSSFQVPSHFRSHTYDTGYSYSKVFAKAVAEESAKKNIKHDLSIPIMHPPIDLSSLERDLPLRWSTSHTLAQGLSRPIPRHHKRNDSQSNTQHSSFSDQSSGFDTPNSVYSHTTLSPSNKSAFELTGTKIIRLTPKNRSEDDSVESSLAGFLYLEADGKVECNLERKADAMTHLQNDDDENKDNFVGVRNETVEDKTFCELVKNLSSEGLNTSSNSSIVPLTPPRSPSHTSKKGDVSSPAQHLRSPL